MMMPCLGGTLTLYCSIAAPLATCLSWVAESISGPITLSPRVGTDSSLGCERLGYGSGRMHTGTVTTLLVPCPIENCSRKES